MVLRAAGIACTLVALLAAAAPAQAAPPANDAFSDAIELAPAASSAPGTTVDATRQSGEPNHSEDGTLSFASVWYRWTAPESATVQLDTCTTNYDTHLGVYTGNAVNALTPVGQNNNGGCSATTGQYGSRVFFHARKGVTYRIAVDGCCGVPTGTFTLTLQAPGNTVFAERAPLSGTTASVISQVGGAAGKETGEGGPSSDQSSVWYTWTAPAAGSVTMNTCGASTTAIDTHLSVYTGSTLPLTPVAANDDTGGCATASHPSYGSSVSFAATAGTTYVIRIARFGSGATRFRLRINPTDVANDDLAGGRALSTRSPDLTESTVGSSHEADEPTAGTAFTFGSLWYRWAAPFGGEAVSVDTCRSAIPTRVRVFTGTALSTLAPAGSSNDSACGNGSVATWTPSAGTNYQVQVENRTAAQGNVRLNWSPQTYISDGPPAAVAATDVQFHFGAYDGASTEGDGMAYACSLDGGAYRPCDSPETYRGVAPGAHTFAVRAIDPLGTADPSPASRRVTTTTPRPAQGPPGPRGPAGLFVGIAQSRLSSVAGKRLRVAYLSTGPADVTLEIRRGDRVVARKNGKAARGRNTVTWSGKVGRKPAKAGRYTARITAVADGVGANDQVPLRVKRPKRR